MKTSLFQNLLSLSAAALIFGGCGSDNNCAAPMSNDPSDFNTTLINHLAMPHQQRNFATYASVERNATAPTHQISGVMIAPLYGGFENSAVLNQGVSNTCVTMAYLGAVGILLDDDAAYFNPICSLNLGNYLHHNANYSAFAPLKNAVAQTRLNYFPSGWNGSAFGLVVAQSATFGLADMNSACGIDGFYAQDAHDNMIEASMFETMAIDVSSRLNHETLCSNNEKDIANCQCVDSTGCIEPNSIVESIKSIVDSGGLALVSSALQSNLPNLGLSKSFYQFDANKTEPNVWAYSEAVRNCRESASAECSIAAHEMIVFGYIEHESNPNEGLLMLRNSWGHSSGDAGNYYMTYEYAQKELLEVVKLSKN